MYWLAAFQHHNIERTRSELALLLPKLEVPVVDAENLVCRMRLVNDSYTQLVFRGDLIRRKLFLKKYVQSFYAEFLLNDRVLVMIVGDTDENVFRTVWNVVFMGMNLAPVRIPLERFAKFTRAPIDALRIPKLELGGATITKNFACAPSRRSLEPIVAELLSI